jgi:hypothetical protein
MFFMVHDVMYSVGGHVFYGPECHVMDKCDAFQLKKLHAHAPLQARSSVKYLLLYSLFRALEGKSYND